MGLFDRLFGRRGGETAQPEGATMRPENPCWVLVEGSTPADIQSAVVAHAGVAKPVQPDRHRVTIHRLDADRFGVTFDPPAPPYALTNLIGWLDDPRMTRGSRRAVGWLISPGSSVRYFLAPRQAHAGNDTLIGVGSDGRRVSVFLPSCRLDLSGERIAAIPEPDLSARGVEPVASFEVTLDGNASFGNPWFVIE
ncbi:hypothetical protein R5W23_001557 [Gemmata sp. JC673]|uniref:Uncharacterized protein n=1 Tax=Gemmata algarum TaxID=2975278 RepID=A0ABU5F0R1_9BACT|nr:hypothetical protein [Gemmata algarum]MDY3560325.1 hypothetical protein [Gemmata algarum]